MTTANPRRAWSLAESERHSLRSNRAPEMSIRAEHASSPYGWENHPGIEGWSLSLDLSYPRPKSSGPAWEATVGAVWLYRVRLTDQFDLVYELDNISYDLAHLGSAVVESKAVADRGICQGTHCDILLVVDAVVDPYWRGAQLGPALVFHAADLLRSDAVFLLPVALTTNIDDHGRCQTSYDLPRPGVDAQAKVERTWRSAGLRKIRNDVVWAESSVKRVGWAHETLVKVREAADERQSRDWARQRHLRRSAFSTAGAP